MAACLNYQRLLFSNRLPHPHAALKWLLFTALKHGPQRTGFSHVHLLPVIDIQDKDSLMVHIPYRRPTIYWSWSAQNKPLFKFIFHVGSASFRQALLFNLILLSPPRQNPALAARQHLRLPKPPVSSAPVFIRLFLIRFLLLTGCFTLNCLGTNFSSCSLSSSASKSLK